MGNADGAQVLVHSYRRVLGKIDGKKYEKNGFASTSFRANIFTILVNHAHHSNATTQAQQMQYHSLEA